MNLTIEPCDACIGARIYGISLADIPDEDEIEAVEDALEKYGVIIFPDQKVTPQQHVAFSGQFAPLELTELEEARLDGVEEIFVVGNVGKGLVAFAPGDPNGELEWHTDHIHHDVAARASLLYAIEVPETDGDTLFACMYSAFESLTPEMQLQYCSLETRNSVAGLEHYLREQGLSQSDENLYGDDYKEVIRPLVRAHPRSGRKGLYFGNQICVGVVGWDDATSRQFIRQLTDHACQPAFQYRHHWHAGDAVLWDNRRVLHAGTPYDTKNSRRHMHRTTWRETEPIELIGSDI